jgi:hypothetical protein
MKKDQELTAITKTYDLILSSCNHTSKFPRNHRFVLGERIERDLYALLETLIRAKYARNKVRLLEEANLTLELLRFQMRLAKDLQCLKVQSYAFAARAVDEVGRPVDWLTCRRLAGSSRNCSLSSIVRQLVAKRLTPPGRGVCGLTGFW